MQIPMQIINFSVLLFVILQAVAYAMKIIFILSGVNVRELLGGHDDELSKIEESLGIDSFGIEALEAEKPLAGAELGAMS